jgi:hypothetical protein
MPTRIRKDQEIKYIKSKTCLHPEHNPPMHIVIPPGSVLEHECPACKKITVIRPMHHTL